MFDLWRKINEEGEAAIPANPSGLSALECAKSASSIRILSQHGI